MTWVAFLLGLALGVAAGLWAARTRGHVPTREEALVRRVYRHLDEIIGATKNENQIRADLRFALLHPRLHLPRTRRWRVALVCWVLVLALISGAIGNAGPLAGGVLVLAAVFVRKNWRLLVPHKLREWYANWMWPIPRVGPGTNPLPSEQRIAEYIRHTPDMRTWTIRYSSEAPANHAPFIEWMERGRPVQGGGLAQALGLEWRAGLFTVERNWADSEVRFTIRDPGTAAQPVVPVGVNADA